MKKLEYDTLLGYCKFMDKKDAKTLRKMIRNKENIEEINIFVNDAITKRQLCRTHVYTDSLENMEFEQYADQLSPEELQWVKKFYYEMYGNAIYNAPKDFRLLKTDELIKQSNRIRNRSKTDAYVVSKTAGKLYYTEDNNGLMPDIEKEDGLSWELVYTYYGYEQALDFIIQETLKELQAGGLDPRLTLVRFYIKMERLGKENRKDKRNG